MGFYERKRMKHLLISFMALGFIVTGCAQKEEVKESSAAPATAAEEKASCDKPDCKCSHHKEAGKCAECQKGGKECDSCKQKHTDCKECAGKEESEKKVEKKKKKSK